MALVLEYQGVQVFYLPPKITQEFDYYAFLTEQREFVPDYHGIRMLGGFGAYGNPSSFHHPEIRALRQRVYEHLKPTLAQAYGHDLYIQAIPDRFSLRPKGSSTTAESWHRDASIPYEKYPDVVAVLGGWVNLNNYACDNSSDQHFSCVLNTHFDEDARSAEGFAKLSKEQAQVYSQRKTNITVPVGQCILFNELTVHEVKNQKQSSDSLRMYVKYIISKRPLGVFEDIMEDHLDRQAVLPYHINSKGEYTYPTMYSPSHVNFWGDQISEFSTNVLPHFTEVRTAGVHRGRTWVQKVMPDLSSANLTFRPYTDEERNYFRPQRLNALNVTFIN